MKKIKRWAPYGSDKSGHWNWYQCDNPEDCKMYHALGQICPCVREHIKHLHKGMSIFIETDEGVEKIVW